jgi:hypothetical protein
MGGSREHNTQYQKSRRCHDPRSASHAINQDTKKQHTEYLPDKV